MSENMLTQLERIRANIKAGTSGLAENVATKAKNEINLNPRQITSITKAIAIGLSGNVEIHSEVSVANTISHALEVKVAGTKRRLAVYERNGNKNDVVASLYCGDRLIPSFIDACLGFGIILNSEAHTRAWLSAYDTQVTSKGYQSLLEADSWDTFHTILRDALASINEGSLYNTTGSPWIAPVQIAEQVIGEDRDIYKLGWNTEELDMRILFPHLADETHVVGNTTSALASMPESLGEYQGSNGAVLKQLVLAGLNVILSGPTGTGKTLCVDEVCKELGLDYYSIAGHESLKEFDLIGSWEPTEVAGKFAWAYGILAKAMMEGKLLFIDEANRMLARVLNVILDTVAGNRKITLTAKSGEEIIAKEGFQIVLAMNEGAGYAVNRLDTALLDRFDAEILFEYPENPEDELAIVKKAVPTIDTNRALCMIAVAQETRRLIKTEELEKCISTRGVIQWATVHMALSEKGDGLLAESAQLSIMSRVTGKDRDGDRNTENRQNLLQILELISQEESIDGIK